MAVRSLFPTGPQAANSNALVSFKAGIMTERPVPGSPKVRVTPDARKGEARLVKGQDGLVYFQWAVRGAAAPEKNLVIFPGDAKLSKIDTKRDGDRIYQLKFAHGNRRIYLWMQEPLQTSDEGNVKKMNDAIDNPAAASAAGGGNGAVSNEMLAQLLGGGGGGGGGGSNAQAQRLAAALQQAGAGGGDLSGLLGALGGGGAAGGGGGGGDPMAGMMMDEDAAMQAALAASLADVGAPAPAAAPTPAPAPAPAEGGAGSGGGDGDNTGAQGTADGGDAAGDGDGDTDMGGDAGAGGDAGGSGSNDAAGGAGSGAGAGAVTLEALAAAMQAVVSGGPRPVPLRHVVNLKEVLPLLADPAVQERLMPLLPEEHRTPEGLRDSVSSPEFQGALGTLTAALQTNNFNTVFANFGLDPRDGGDHMARGDGVAAFLAALEARARRRDPSGEDGGDGDTADGNDDA